MAALKHGIRKFYEIPSGNLPYVRHDRKVKKLEKIEELFKYIDNSCIGKDLTFTGPYGLRKGKLQYFKTSVSLHCFCIGDRMISSAIWN